MCQMPMTFDDASLKLLVFIGHYPAPKSAWYAGITCDPERLLYVDHNVDRDTNTHLVVQCQTKQEAATLKDYLVEDYGCTGVTGDSNDHGLYVFVYLMSESTVP